MHGNPGPPACAIPSHLPSGNILGLGGSYFDPTQKAPRTRYPPKPGAECRCASSSSELAELTRRGAGFARTPPVPPFSRVHGLVGRSQCLVRRLAGRGVVDAHADTDADRPAVDEVRLAKRAPKPPGQRIKPLRVDPGGDDGELVTA